MPAVIKRAWLIGPSPRCKLNVKAPLATRDDGKTRLYARWTSATSGLQYRLALVHPPECQIVLRAKLGKAPTGQPLCTATH